jgi:hypothetical protein
MLKLRYNGSDIEIKLGDRIQYNHIFFGSSEGVVYYIPGESPVHKEFEYEGIKNWAIKLNSGRVISWIYLPGEVQASKRIQFIERCKGSFQGLQPNEELL